MAEYDRLTWVEGETIISQKRMDHHEDGFETLAGEVNDLTALVYALQEQVESMQSQLNELAELADTLDARTRNKADGQPISFWAGESAEYNALIPDSQTLYFTERT